MKKSLSRREFLAEVGCGMLVATVGYEVASGLALSSALADERSAALSFGALEPLVCLMQETPANQLLPLVVQRLRSEADLRQLTAAAAFANARTFGGEDYVGFHTMMALAPALHLSQEMPAESQPLPVLKVLYRNTNRIQEHGGRKGEVLLRVQPETAGEGRPGGAQLREAVRSKNVNAAEGTFARIAQGSPSDALNDLLWEVQDQTEVHRVVLPYRAWDLLGLIGMEQAHTLLRQSVRYCVKAESWSYHSAWEEPRSLLPRLLAAHKLDERGPGAKAADDNWVEQMSQTFFKSNPEQAAEAAAAALAEGMAPGALGEAISLAANQLILRDHGRTPCDEVPGKPLGSVHGDSIGVHACDSANAWRNLARLATRGIVLRALFGLYQVALDRTARGGDFSTWEPLPLKQHLDQIKKSDAATLMREADEAIRGNLQARASAIVQRYGDLGYPARPMFDLMLRYAVSEDGALHAEKFYRTVSEEFASARDRFRWRHLVALARVTASEYGCPAAGVAEAKELLKS